jgi:hypothetical protein
MFSTERNPACMLSCLAACFLTTVVTSFVTLFAASVLVSTPIHKSAVTAAVFNVLALTMLCVCAVFHIRASRALLSRKRILAPIMVLLFVVALAMSIYVFGWMYNNLHLVNTKEPIQQIASMVAAAMSMWALLLMSVIVYLSLFLRQKSSLPDLVISTSNPLQSCIDIVEPKNQSLSLHTISPHPNRPVSTFSDYSDHSTSIRSSLRNSFQNFLRYNKSSPNIFKQSRESARTDSMSERRPSDGFETWDVAPPSPVVELTSGLTAIRAAQQYRLETIPGSRSVSSAHPIAGPLAEEEEEADKVAVSPVFPTFAPCISRRPSVQQSNQDESHIHPLFRSDSPIPSPLASPGTIITSSPYAGQVISPTDVAFGSHSRNGSLRVSRPSSPNPSLIRPGSGFILSRPPSSRSIRGLAASKPLQGSKLKMSPSLGDLRAERDRCVKSPRTTFHTRERSA